MINNTTSFNLQLFIYSIIQSQLYQIDFDPMMPNPQKDQIIIRRLKNIHSTEYDPHSQVYKLQVSWEGGTSEQTIFIHQIFLSSMKYPTNQNDSINSSTYQWILSNRGNNTNNCNRSQDPNLYQPNISHRIATAIQKSNKAIIDQLMHFKKQEENSESDQGNI